MRRAKADGNPIPSGSIWWVELTDTLLPGQSAPAKLLKENAANYRAVTKPSTFTIYDPHRRNFGLPGERLQVMRTPQGRLECVGTYGLEQLGKAAGTILTNNTGSVNIWHVPQSTPVDSTYSIIAHHNWMAGSASIATDTEVVVRYFTNWSRWVILAAECPE